MVADHISGGVDRLMREIVRYPPALAVLPGQLVEAQKTHPGAKFVWKDKAWHMEIKTRQEKLKRLKERGWVELD